MAINDKLRFSWGHIMAFVAMIFISYVSFMGLTYLTDGNFLYAGLGVFIIILILSFFFIGVQMLKATDTKFRTRIKWERLFFVLTFAAFLLVMVPYSHFWIVFDKRQQVEETFSNSVQTTKGMFASYEAYAQNRIDNYRKKLIQDDVESYHRNNLVEALQLQMLDENYENLKKSAFKWIDNVSDVSVWNVFVIGNIKEVEESFETWNKTLNGFTTNTLEFEPEEAAFTPEHPSVKTAKDNISSLHATYTIGGDPTLIVFITGVVLYLMLLLPYIVQPRNSKSLFRLIGKESSIVKSDNGEYEVFKM